MRNREYTFRISGSRHTTTLYYPDLKVCANGTATIEPSSQFTAECFGPKITVPVYKDEQNQFYLDIGEVRNFGPRMQPGFRSLVAILTGELSHHSSVPAKEVSICLPVEQPAKSEFMPRLGRDPGRTWKTGGIPLVHKPF